MGADYLIYMKSYCCYFSLFTLLIFIGFPSLAQDKCAVPAYMEMLQKRHPQLAGEQAFEQWISDKKIQQDKAADSPFREQQTIYELPVVVHVIHNGENVGTDANISERQILSQLETLNEDFRKLNENQVSQLPSGFRSLAADTRIQFVLARQNPEGLPTSGITRTQGSRSVYNPTTDDFELKSLIHWSPDDYINIYVAPLSNPYIGYAQFPETDKLAGLDQGLSVAQTDGVVIDYRYFGQGGSAVSGSRGRTATHELGHYFGLRHIWGDGDCDRDDYVEDTPPADGEHTGCPTDNPQSCGTPDMYQNYMDYTDDRCMSLFTQGQAERMEVVLQHSPRRRSLQTSFAKEEPVVVANDAGLRQLILNLTDPCTKDFIPEIEVRNYGNNNVNSVEVGIFISGQLHMRQTFSLDLGELESAFLQFPEVVIPQRGLFIAEARILSTNGGTDGKEFNNNAEAELYAPHLREVPYLQDFETSLSPFYRLNPDYNLTWELEEAPITGDPDNLAMYLDYFDYSINIGAEDLLISPIFDLSDEDIAFLSFRVAYATYDRSSMDRLEVYVSTNCSESLDDAVRIYDKAGEALASAPENQLPFVPSGNQDWRNELLDLSDFAGNSQVQLIFVGTNDWGNNIYVDDIDVFTEPRDQLDVALRAINSPSVVSCEQNPVPALRIRNMGKETINSLDVVYALDDGPDQLLSLTDLDLQSQASQQILLPQLTFSGDGEHTLQVNLSSPNGGFDDNPTNNSRIKQFVINSEEEVIPFRQQFTSAPINSTDWVSTSPDPENSGWEVGSAPGTSPDKNNFVVVSKFFGEPRGLENWLASPVLDLSEASLAGLEFDYSYAPIANASDILQVRVSVDCGESWNDIVYERKGSELSSRIVDNRWSPARAEDWFTAFINLSEYVGLPDVRVAIVAISDAGNDLYLDNIEFYESDQPITVQIPEEGGMTAFPNPTNQDLNLIFNLRQREDVQLQLYDSHGRLVYQATQPNTLNQVYSINTNSLHPGMYILMVHSDSLQRTERIIIAR